MNMMTSSQGQQPVSGGFRVDVSRGQRIGRVSSDWFSRPDDERYLNLPELYEAVRGRAERAQARTVESRAIRVEATRENSERLALIVPGCDQQVSPTHWSFGQLCTLVGAPTSYLRQLPAALSAINLQHGLLSHRAELVKTLEADNGCVELRAVTGPDYGRIWDHELVAAVMKIAGNGIGDTRWKVPGVLDWKTMTHNPFVDVTKDTTTLYASDRDVFLFLVDDTNPIEAATRTRAQEGRRGVPILGQPRRCACQAFETFQTSVSERRRLKRPRAAPTQDTTINEKPTEGPRKANKVFSHPMHLWC